MASRRDSSSSSSSPFPPPPPRAPASFLDVCGLVAATGFWEARRCVDLCRETKFEFCGGGALADMLEGGLRVSGCTAALRAARARTREAFRGFSSTTQLTRAAYSGDLRQLRTLLELGADANARDGGGRTALYWSASGGHVDAMRALLERGANVHLADRSGWPALLKAAGMGQDAAVALLLENGADVRAQLPEGSYFFARFTALDLARRGKHDAVVARLEAAMAAALAAPLEPAAQ